MLRKGLKWLPLLALACAGSPREALAAPPRLSDTGLYVDGSNSVVRDGVLPFSPQYPLWSDGATKRRWIWIPSGTSIDATRPDAWDFPRGTKLWKEFSNGGRIETRFIERQADGGWSFASYVWSADGRDAMLAPAAGIRAVPSRSGPYAIPAEDDCRACHEGAPVPVLGFSALQLSSDRDALAPHADSGGDWPDLRSLAALGVLRNVSSELLAHPPRIAAANAVERAALGYLHGNCGHCHNDDGPLAVLDMTLAQRVATPTAASGVVHSLQGVPSQFRAAGAPAGAPRVAPGDAAGSVLALRMNSRDPLQQMPPLGTAVADAGALALIARWIDGLSVH